MRLIRFQSADLNGYLNFDLDLGRKLSFLVGINGSGKTTILRAIMALLTPDIAWLATTSYRKIELDVEIDGLPICISAQRVEGDVLLDIKREGKNAHCIIGPDMVAKHTRIDEGYSYDDDGQMVYLRESHIEVPASVPALMLIRDLPTPIFLGLDRTTLGHPKKHREEIHLQDVRTLR